MLKRLKIENFKAWREVDLGLGKVTGLFGTNSSGKSSLLQLLLLLKQTRDATDRGLVLDLGGPADIVNLGTFKDAVHLHDESQRIGWLLDWTLQERLSISDPMGRPADLLFEGDCLQARCEVGLRQAQIWPYELAYRFDETDFRLQSKIRPRDEIRSGYGQRELLVQAQRGSTLAALPSGQNPSVSGGNEKLVPEFRIPWRFRAGI